jgi:hypothetical protein
MAYNVSWLVDKRIIYFRTTGTVTIDQVKNANKQIMIMLEEGTPFIHLLTDTTNADKISFSLSDLMSVFRGMPATSALGWSVYVSPKMLDRFFANITTQMSNSRHREFSSLDEAIAFLQSVDETLPEIVVSKQSQSLD